MKFYTTLLSSILLLTSFHGIVKAQESIFKPNTPQRPRLWVENRATQKSFGLSDLFSSIATRKHIAEDYSYLSTVVTWTNPKGLTEVLEVFHQDEKIYLIVKSSRHSRFAIARGTNHFEERLLNGLGDKVTRRILDLKKNELLVVKRTLTDRNLYTNYLEPGRSESKKFSKLFKDMDKILKDFTSETTPTYSEIDIWHYRRILNLEPPKKWLWQDLRGMQNVAE